MTTHEHPIANPEEFVFDHDSKLFHMWAGAYSNTHCYVWARGFEDAFEVFTEWLDDNAPGCLTTLDESDLKDAAKDLNLVWPQDPESPEYYKIIEHAEADLTVIGHTTLKHGTHIASWEWGGDEVTDHDEWKAAALRSDTNTYYAYGNGQPGCLHDGQSGPYESEAEAVEAAASWLELSDEERETLETAGSVYLSDDRRHEVGAAMVEVFEVDCTWEPQG